VAGTGRLCIYDSADSVSKRIAHGRDADFYLGADSRKSLQKGLDDLVTRGTHFRRLVFDTHGNNGRIYFGNERLDTYWLIVMFSGRKYEQLFPNYSRMYFSGCNISDDDAGWIFLEEISGIFFSTGGGVTLAYTSVRFAARWWFEWTPKHLWGEVRYVIRTPGKPVAWMSGSDLVRDMINGTITPFQLSVIRGE